MTTTARPPSPTGETSARVLPLRNGDRLTRDEFERRYRAMPDVNGAELVEGTVYMPSPVSHEDHGAPHFRMISWLGLYFMATPGISAGDNSSLRLDADNMPQPDAFLMILPQHGGQARIGADGYVEGAPELIVEVAASSASYDLHDKLNAYRRAGVCEYVVWRVWDGAIDWLSLQGGRYVPLPAGDDGIYRSEVFPGLWLEPAALMSGDMARVAEVQRQGLAADEYRQFAERLSAPSGE